MVLHIILHVLVPSLSLAHFLLEGAELLKLLSFGLLAHTRDYDCLLCYQLLLLLHNLLLAPLKVLLDLFLFHLERFLLDLVSLTELLLLYHVFFNAFEV